MKGRPPVVKRVIYRSLQFRQYNFFGHHPFRVAAGKQGLEFEAVFFVGVDMAVRCLRNFSRCS